MAEPKRHTDVLERVLVVPTSSATLPNPNVRKFRKFLTFHHPVTAFSELLVGSYTKIVTRIGKKMLS